MAECGIIDAPLEESVASPVRTTVTAVLLLSTCLWISGCLHRAPQRSPQRPTRLENPANRRLSEIARPRRRVTQERRNDLYR